MPKLATKRVDKPGQIIILLFTLSENSLIVNIVFAAVIGTHHWILGKVSKMYARIELFETLCKHFNRRELKEVCFYLQINHEDIKTDRTREFARELIEYCERNRKFHNLVERVVVLRPFLIKEFKNDFYSERALIVVFFDDNDYESFPWLKAKLN